MRGIADGHDLRVWHDVYVDGVSNLMTPEDAYAGAMLGFAEALKSGITTVMSDTIDPRQEARAAGDMGIRARLFAHIIHEDEAGRYFELLRSQEGTEEDLVRFWAGLESATASTPRTLQECRKHADELGLRIHTHFSEKERQDIDKLIETGFLGPDVHMAHCIQVTSEDIDKIATSGAMVAHCPTSNMKLANGVALIPEIRQKGIAVGIATDGLMSVSRLDMFEQMRVAALIQRGTHRNPKILSVEELLAMVTRDAARVMGMEKRLGSLEAGKQADIVILNTEKMWLTPLIHEDAVSNLLELIVWSATSTDVNTVLVNGNVLVRNGELTSHNESKIQSKVQEIGRRILREARFG